MDLAPNSTKSMECLKRYSAKAGFVLTREVGWKLPTFATHYTTYRFDSFFPTQCVPSPPSPSRMTNSHLAFRAPAAASPCSAGRPDHRGTPQMSRPPPPLQLLLLQASPRVLLYLPGWA
jgi:hypothetical protein